MHQGTAILNRKQFDAVAQLVDDVDASPWQMSVTKVTIYPQLNNFINVELTILGHGKSNYRLSPDGEVLDRAAQGS